MCVGGGGGGGLGRGLFPSTPNSAVLTFITPLDEQGETGFALDLGRVVEEKR